MNVFATLKTVFFGSKFLSSPVPIDGTPRRDLVSALNGLMPLCRTIPGVRLALDIREGQVVLALNWTPRTDGNAPTGSYHYIVSDEDGVREMADSQVLLTENGKDNLPGSMDDSRTHPTVSTEKTEKDSAHLKKDVQKKAGPTSLEDTGKKAKSHTLMQEVTAFLTSRYRFRFNVLTEETEVASVENNIPDTHLRYTKVDERWMNSLSLEAIETGIDCWDRDIQRFVRSRRISSALNIRKAYKHSASSLPRIASFIGTSNREDLLVDRTGSRRFLCVSLKHAIDCTTSVEHKQLYAQLKTELLSGERSWFNKEEEQTIQQHNALFYKHVPEEEVFRLCFRFATEEDNPQEVLSLSATQLFERMKAAHPSIMREMTAYSLSRILPQLGERVHTTKGNVYRVVEC